MQHCPICRALLNGAETCRRCRAELRQVQEVERQGRALTGEAMRLLARGDAAAAGRVLRRACVVHATPEVRLLLNIVAAAGPLSTTKQPGSASDDSGAMIPASSP